VFEADATYVTKFGGFGTGPGQFNRPSSMTIDELDRLFVVDGMNHRVQIMSTDGTFLGSFGTEGSEPGQFSLPWGICLGPANDLYVADWQNDRIQRLTREGQHLATIGTPGTEEGQLKRPSGVGVDRDGYIFVADWGNERVQVFKPEGQHFTTLIGDATLSTWAKDLLADRPDLMEQRALVEDMDVEKRFWGPITVKFDADGRILILDSCRYRIQIYLWADADQA